jgi:hypothetical protein
MSDNLPAVRTEAPSAAVVRRDTDSWADQLPAIVELARSICGTDFVPEAMRDNVAATAAAILYGREVALPPMTALGNVNVIKGKPGLSAVIMRAQVLAAGHEIRQDASDNGRCVLSGRRRGTDYWQTVTYTIDDARQAGHMKNDQYTKNPRRMLRARATSELCELMFADVVRGMPSLEELEDLDDDVEAVPAAPAARGKVQRKTRATKTDDGAANAADAPAAGVPSAAPSSPPMPPLPGEPGYDDADGAVGGEPASAEGSRTVGPAETDDGAGPPPSWNSASANASPAPSSLPAKQCELTGPHMQHTTADFNGPTTLCPGIASPATSPLPPLPGEEDLPPEAEEITDPQRGKLFALMTEHGLASRDQQIGWISKNLGREITSRSQVNKDDAIKLIDLLESTDVATPRPIGRGDLRLLAGIFRELAISDMDERLHIASSIVGRTPMKEGAPSPEGLTAREGKTLLDALARCKTRDHVEALVQMAEQERAQGGEQDA